MWQGLHWKSYTLCEKNQGIKDAMCLRSAPVTLTKKRYFSCLMFYTALQLFWHQGCRTLHEHVINYYVFTVYVKLGLIKQNLSPYRRGTCRKHIVTGSGFLKIRSNLQQIIKLLNIHTAEYSLCTHKLYTHGIQSYFVDYVSTTQDKKWGGKQTQIWSWLTTLQ